LLIINSNLSMPFKFLPGMCHPTIEAPKSLNNSQSKKEKKNLNLSNNINCHHCLWTSSSLKQTITNNI
jgi:hypothetical protein